MLKRNPMIDCRMNIHKTRPNEPLYTKLLFFSESYWNPVLLMCAFYVHCSVGRLFLRVIIVKYRGWFVNRFRF